MKYEHILDTVGRTPVVRLGRLEPEGRRLFAKVEAFNPLGSVKDRLALGIIEDAEKRGALRPGQTVIEATSGNTGIGLAMVCARKGYPLVLVMSEVFSVERRKLMRFLGAKVVLTPAGERGMGMLGKAKELADAHGWFLCRQFDNEANAEIHSRTTAREILADFDGERLDYFVTGFGTGGTLKGVARVLKAERPEVRIAACEPENSQMMASGVRQPFSDDGVPTSTHPMFRTHLMQGWAPDFIPKLAEDARDQVDAFVPIDGAEAIETSIELARKEGIFTGISGGATLAAALRLCREAPEGSTVLCLLPDTGERYLSTPLFADIDEEMTPGELEISVSTPNHRFDRPIRMPPEMVPEGAPTEISPEAVEFVDRTIAEATDRVAMFALTYCEFCWAVSKLFKAAGIPFEKVNLDSTEMQVDDRGGKIRYALSTRSGSVTMPQVFIGGEFVGGCEETLIEFKNGKLQSRLDNAGIEFDKEREIDAATVLPRWLHSRRPA
ncbi:MAG: cysteine synthase [Acidobacteria bacterium]|nr:cysteine synthase [Acidobacteriota bacterium]NIM63766.1 cysteine synthase [Acidobacteriota bacterium]NIO59335.1 cysteine synthase [Acidobacteriota bacterium]NIQ30349.1 cysteine synthase [Acidobacteriota bacterium]NIQ85286.1 cysteine synthase [Acidobacteriota bacterium]